MKVTYISDERIVVDFAQEAAHHFNDYPMHWSYANGNPTEGNLLALRWGPTGQAVLVLRVAEEFPVTVYADCVTTPPYPRRPEGP